MYWIKDSCNDALQALLGYLAASIIILLFALVVGFMMTISTLQLWVFTVDVYWELWKFFSIAFLIAVTGFYFVVTPAVLFYYSNVKWNTKARYVHEAFRRYGLDKVDGWKKMCDKEFENWYWEKVAANK